jgi:hypothetical protein
MGLSTEPQIKQGNGKLFQLRQAEDFDPQAGGGIKESPTAYQLTQGQSAGVAAAALLLQDGLAHG